MSAVELLIRYGVFIPVMTRDEQRRLAMGELQPDIYTVCGWCRALMERQNEVENRISKAMKVGEKPQENRK